MHEARRRPHVLGHVGEEGDHVVAHLALDLGDALGVEVGALADFRHRVGGYDTTRTELFTDGHFHLQPVAIAGVLGPEGAHFGSRITLDHCSPACRNVYPRSK